MLLKYINRIVNTKIQVDKRNFIEKNIDKIRKIIILIKIRKNYIFFMQPLEFYFESALNCNFSSRRKNSQKEIILVTKVALVKKYTIKQ